MKKNNYYKIIIETIIVLILMYNLLSYSTNEEYQIPVLEISNPSENIVKAVFSSPDGEYIGKKETVTIAANGDIMFHGTQIRNAYNPTTKSYEFDYCFENIKKYIANADIAIGNFETTTAGGTPTGYPIFNAPDETLRTLSAVGYDILTTANNHCLDKGKNGIIKTIETIEKYGMTNVGTYKEKGQHIEILDIKGIKLSVLSYTYGLNGMDSLLTKDELTYMVNLIKEEKIERDIKQSRKLGADFVLVFIHWGNEYQLNPSTYQKTLSRKMVDWGADIILGSHPHVVQPSEIIKKDGQTKYIIYSMGNLISNQRRETLNSISNRNYTEDGVIVNISIQKDFVDNSTSIVGVNYVPTWVHRYKESGKYKYEILPVNEFLGMGDLDSTTINKLKVSYENTMSRMELYRDLAGSHK